ncbi:hypothetical protein [Streptomyces europaeiscabiei]|nr:hypothetical protein OHB30_01950 [Streptomyces europaeiscabiei]
MTDRERATVMAAPPATATTPQGTAARQSSTVRIWSGGSATARPSTT